MIITCNEPVTETEYKLWKGLFKIAIKYSGAKYKKISVDINFVDEAEIKKLNKKHRNKDEVTDVLSFPALKLVSGTRINKKEHLSDINQETKHLHLGDIAVCKTVVKKQAQENGHSEHRELCYLIVHGFLHLLGFDHIRPEEQLIMRGLEEEVLKKFRIKRESDED
ncbi:MAG: rRNA maturation RNase YbeY [Christensenellaceae bacterium]|jgi:probable rRNA maturation factor|nr:rRNA maturation RNase YbeY [Christensenellaceae bacterium]